MRAVQADRLDLDPDDLLALQVLEKPGHDPGLAPAVHAGVNGMPVAESPR